MSRDIFQAEGLTDLRLTAEVNISIAKSKLAGDTASVGEWVERRRELYKSRVEHYGPRALITLWKA